MRRHIVTVGLVLATAGMVAGCSSEPDLGPVFNSEGDVTVSCMAHQTEEPGPRYTTKEVREQNVNQVHMFALLKYYTAHGSLAYCDGAAANEDDKAWAQTYLDLTGADPSEVSSVLG